MSDLTAAVALGGRGSSSFLAREVDLTAEPVHLSFAVEPLAPHGAVAIIAGQRGAAKTMLLTQLAAAVGRPEPSDVAGMRCHPGRALILDGENGATIMADRLRAMALPASAFRYFDMAGVRLDHEDAMDALAETIRATDATFVVLDSLRRLSGKLREDSADDMSALVGGIATVARQTEAAIIILHHRSTKAGAATLRGSSAIEDQADLVFRLDVHGNGPRRTLANAKNRVGPPLPPVALTLLSDPLRLVAVDAGRSAERDALVLAISELMIPADGWKLSEIADALEFKLDDTTRKTLQRAIQRFGGLALDGRRYLPFAP